MALLLRALRDVRIRSGELDPLPELARGNFPHLGDLTCKLGEAALPIDRAGSPSSAQNPSQFVTPSSRQPDEDRR